MRATPFIPCFIAVLSALSPGPSLAAEPAGAIHVSDFQQLTAAVQAVAGFPKGGTILLKGGRYLGTRPLVLDRAGADVTAGGNGTINLWAEPGREVILDFSALRDIDTPS